MTGPINRIAFATTMTFAALRLKGEVDHLVFSNPRTRSGLETAKIRELAFHILHHGLLTPLLVKPDGLVLAGQRRYRALELLSADLVTLERDGDLAAPYLVITQQERANATALLAAIPVRVFDGDWSSDNGIALADNLLREDLSSYEIAARLVEMSDAGITGRELARRIGKTPSYVSGKLTTYRAASTELLSAWEFGTITEEQASLLAAKPHDKQRAALDGTKPLPVRHSPRPKVEALKDALLNVEQKARTQPGNLSAAYTKGVLDALRWVTGHNASPSLVELVEEES